MSQVTHITGNTDTTLTMSSREIANLIGKRHDHVMRDITKMLDDLGESGNPNFGGSYVTGQNKRLPCFNLPRRETDILLTGYSVTLRAKVIDRWRELEGHVVKPQFQVPTTLHGALLLAANLEEQRAALTLQVEVKDQKIALDKPKVDYYKKVRESTNTETIGDFAKKLDFGSRKLFKWLREQKILMTDNSPYQRYLDAGHFRVIDKTTEKNGKVITYSQTVLTGKGKTYVQKRLAKAGNPDLSE